MIEIDHIEPQINKDPQHQPERNHLFDEAYEFSKGVQRSAKVLICGTADGAFEYTAQNLKEHPIRVCLEAAGFAATGAVVAATLPEEATLALTAVATVGSLSWFQRAYEAAK